MWEEAGDDVGTNKGHIKGSWEGAYNLLTSA